jgi:hypothetical protein
MTDLEVSIVGSVLAQKSQDICGRPRLAATQEVEREEELEAVVYTSSSLESQILTRSASRFLARIHSGLVLTNWVEVVPASGGAMFKAKASMPLPAASRMSDSQFAAAYAPLLPTWIHQYGILCP